MKILHDAVRARVSTRPFQEFVTIGSYPPRQLYFTACTRLPRESDHGLADRPRQPSQTASSATDSAEPLNNNAKSYFVLAFLETTHSKTANH